MTEDQNVFTLRQTRPKSSKNSAGKIPEIGGLKRPMGGKTYDPYRQKRQLWNGIDRNDYKQYGVKTVGFETGIS